MLLRLGQVLWIAKLDCLPNKPSILSANVQKNSKQAAANNLCGVTGPSPVDQAVVPKQSRAQIEIERARFSHMDRYRSSFSRIEWEVRKEGGPGA